MAFAFEKRIVYQKAAVRRFNFLAAFRKESTTLNSGATNTRFKSRRHFRLLRRSIISSRLAPPKCEKEKYGSRGICE
jgi:hypothetical protein